MYTNYVYSLLFFKTYIERIKKNEAQLKTENVIDKEQDGIEQLKNALSELLFTDSQSLLNKKSKNNYNISTQ